MKITGKRIVAILAAALATSCVSRPSRDAHVFIGSGANTQATFDSAHAHCDYAFRRTRGNYFSCMRGRDFILQEVAGSEGIIGKPADDR